MKRVKAACILQTLVFAQRPEAGFSKEKELELNRQEVIAYKKGLDEAKTRYIITEETEQSDSSILIRIKKQYNDKTETAEYFN